MDFQFEYGSLSYKHRFSIKRSLYDYEETILDKVISVSTQLVYKTMACDKLVYEVLILYRDSYNKTQLLKLDLHDYNVHIIKLGDCSFTF